MRIFSAALCILLIGGCQKAPEPAQTSEQPVTEAAEAPSATSLADILAAQPDEVQARFAARNPQQTLEFFGIEPGMTVVEGLPGRGWYTRILLPYLGDEGCLIAADYSLDMYPLFPFGDDEFMAKKREWLTTFVDEASEWRGGANTHIEAFHFGSMPDKLEGMADAVFFPRVLHNLARFESEGDFLTHALADAHRLLKPGGTLAVVQHHARDEMPDAFADGSKGYLKKAFVIDVIEQAGFEFVAESDINANPKDQPGEDDIVWRLPPTLATSREDDELKAEYEAIGESNRMTLKFRKAE